MERLTFLRGHDDGAPVAFRGGRAVGVDAFCSDVARVAAVSPPGDVLFNLCEDRYEFALVLAAGLVRGEPCVLPPDQAPATLAQLRREFRGVTCVSGTAPASAAEVSISAMLDAAEPAVRPELRFTADRLAALVFTSGSSGIPKRVDKTWGALAGVGRQLGRRLPVPARGCVVATVPAQHMYGLEASVMLPLQNGGALTSERPLFPDDIRAVMGSLPGPRVLVSTPLHLHACTRAEVTFPAVALTLSATAPLDPDVAGRAQTIFGGDIEEIYGFTEAGCVATRAPLRDRAWQPLDEVSLERSREGVAVHAPYLSEPVPFPDVVEVRDDGQFELLGRQSDLVNVAGKRASLQDLTQKLLGVEGVKDAVYFLPDDLAPGARVHRLAALAVAPGHTAADLESALRERVDAAFLPRPLLMVERLPRNAAGKLPRASVLEMFRRLRPGRRGAPVIRIPPDHPALPGHFPDHPVVPGITLLEAVVREADRLLEEEGAAERVVGVKSAKFLRTVEPDEGLALNLEHVRGEVRFTLAYTEGDTRAGEVTLRGVLICG